MSVPQDHNQPAPRRVAEVLSAFLRLGLLSFGGPIAHIGYFRREFVEKRRWLTDGQFAQLLALCQLLPGPASSQLGFAIGLVRGSWAGALSAFLAFTFPSAILLFLFAMVSPYMSGVAGQAVIHGLKLVALAVVAHAVIMMGRKLCPDPPRIVIALVVTVLLLITSGLWLQVAVIVFGAAAGALLVQEPEVTPEVSIPLRYGRKLGWAFLLIFLVLLGGLPLFAQLFAGRFAIAEAFYRAGALVFGGGHVVLPFLEQAIVAPGWLSQGDFMAGYGAAQAVPGPMFTLSVYLGAHLEAGLGGLAGAMVALIAIFSPGFLLLAAALPLWSSFALHPKALRAIAGINAAVVGILAAALYDPIWTSSVHGLLDVLVAVIGFAMLAVWRLPALIVVAWCIVVSMVSALLF